MHATFRQRSSRRSSARIERRVAVGSSGLAAWLLWVALVPIARGQVGWKLPAERLGPPLAARVLGANRRWQRPVLRVPWPARHRSGVRVREPGEPAFLAPDPGALTELRLRSLGLRGSPRTRIAPEHWPPEPASPAAVRADAFAAALGCVCPPEVPDETVARVARAALDAASSQGVDPFLLAALAFHQSRCEPSSRDSYGIGLCRVNVGMHAAHIRDDGYRYRRPLPRGGFQQERVPLGGHQLSARALLEPETNLFFSAVFLRVFQAQCPAIDSVFGSVPHRDPVSHVIFGDEVRSALPEAQLLTVRRRLLAYYSAQDAVSCVSCERGRSSASAASRVAPVAPVAPSWSSDHGAYLASPLDGSPRIVIGVLGDPRDHGARLHAGIDLMASEGEPVRAVQAGVVINAGVELRGRGLIDLPPWRATEVPLGRMGPRGLFVRVEHAGALVSIYAHLSRYTLQVGDTVARGQLIGYVGRTGVQASDAHLHFGLFDRNGVVDPLLSLDRYVRYANVPASPAMTQY